MLSWLIENRGTFSGNSGATMATYLEYMSEAMRRAQYEELEGGEGWYAHIPGFEGLWASGKSIEETRAELKEALDAWLTVNLFVSQLPLPDIGVSLGVEKQAE
jgi:predicted RNase H-like HicB family nuclease